MTSLLSLSICALLLLIVVVIIMPICRLFLTSYLGHRNLLEETSHEQNRISKSW